MTLLLRTALGVCLAAPGLLAGCTFAPPPAESFSEAVYLYRQADPDKAIALAATVQDGRGRSAWGVFTGSLTQDHADEKALESCRENARRAGIGASCHLFAVGDEPAPQTLEGCRSGRIDPYRCELQKRHAGALAAPAAAD